MNQHSQLAAFGHSAFANNKTIEIAACDRLVGAVLVERHETWQAESAVYLNMEHLDRNDSTGRKSKAAA